ncbi:MAG: XTP/dITP diphosphatase [Clostridiales bacterium]|nr:XTP/dITP diphosphatase [Clostridiales bacterium]
MITKNKPALVVASANAHKLTEIAEILTEYQIVSMKEAGFTADVEETGNTFEENAILKASTVAKALNLPALADDSGLMVDALNGAPGVFSARYSGKHGNDKANNQKLLLDLVSVEKKDRTARFCTVVALCYPSGETVTALGQTEGEILFAPEGENGFGYDPIFYSYDLGKSFALATAEEKNAVSHRFRALTNLKQKVQL